MLYSESFACYRLLRKFVFKLTAIFTLTSIMLSTHALAVERLRYQERFRAPVPRAWRLCRFCHMEVEDEVHVLSPGCRSSYWHRPMEG